MLRNYSRDKKRDFFYNDCVHCFLSYWNSVVITYVMLLLAAPIVSQVSWNLMLLWHLEFLDLHEMQFIEINKISKKLCC